MDIINRAVGPLEWRSSFSKILKTENYIFFTLILGILAHVLTVLFIVLSNMECRPITPIPDEFAFSLSQIDGPAYLNTVCTTEIKTRRWYAFLSEFLIIFLIMGYGAAVKWPLRYLKLNYFMFYRLPIPEFNEMPIRFSGSEEEFDQALKRRMYMHTLLYLFSKYLSMLVLISALVAHLIIKYTITEWREFFLPVETTCGPTLFWNDIRGTDVDIGEYFCHYKEEWSVFLLTLLTDVFTAFLIVLFVFQAISLFVMFLCTYNDTHPTDYCTWLPDSSRTLDAFLNINHDVAEDGEFEEKLLTWDVHNNPHIGPRTSYNQKIDEI